MDFASFVGVVRSGGAFNQNPDRWADSISRLSSRVDGLARQIAARSQLAAYRGNNNGFYQHDSIAVLIDGTVENLHVIARSSDRLLFSDHASDAEIFAKLYEQCGDALLSQITGSFSLVIVRHVTGEVTLVRDRFGSRPLFYAATSDGWAWASEIKCLCPLVGSTTLDPEGLRQAVHYRYTIGDSLLKGISQVLPASFVRLVPGKAALEVLYWRLSFKPSESKDDLDAWADRADSGLDACIAQLQTRHSRVGVLLSGGVDSSLLALKVLKGGFKNCIALTARWRGENPELELACSIARHIGIEHHVVDIDESRFEQLLPWIIWRQEELPRHFHSLVLAGLLEFASSHCDAILHGHSADALFGQHEFIALSNFNRRRRLASVIPRPLRRAIASQLPSNRTARISRVKSYLEQDEHGFMKSLFAINYGKAGIPVNNKYSLRRGPSPRALAQFYEVGDTAIERLQRLGTYTFNQSHLAVLDRLSAPMGIPVVTPFISPEMVEIASELPVHLKAIGTMAKPVLKRLMARSFPTDWVYRDKQGFPTQATRWLAGPLHRWHQMLQEDRTAARDVLSPSALHENDVELSHEAIWTSICLEIFCRQFVDGQVGPS